MKIDKYMKTPTRKSMILKIGILFLAVFILIPKSNIQAVDTSISNLYDNPNQSTESQYKFAAAQVLKSGLIQTVIGCTGVTDTVATWMMKTVQSKKMEEMLLEKEAEAERELLINSCSSIKAAGEAGAGSIPQVNNQTDTVGTALEATTATTEQISQTATQALSTDNKIKACIDQVNSYDAKTLAALKKQREGDEARQIKEQCFDGIAVALAKNQLTSMTRSVMNWANTGFGGNPFFAVTDLDSLGKNIEKEQLNSFLYDLQFGSSPYNRDFAASLITSYKNRNEEVGNVKSDLWNFIKYKGEDIVADNVTEKAEQANQIFADDFSTGGWDGWLALTQRDQNNPWGYSIITSQTIADKIKTKIEDTQSELEQNGGFLNQKKCVKWQLFDNTGKPIMEDVCSPGEEDCVNDTNVFKYSKTKSSTIPNYDICIEFKNITPGSLIKDKVSNYLTSPERQLELSKTINDSLNALFSVLIYKLEEGGLAGLSDSSVLTNWTDNINNPFTETELGEDTSISNKNPYGNFSITRDLGNTYIHDNTFSLGEWDAKNNITKPTNKNYSGMKPLSLSPLSLPASEQDIKDGVPTTNSYYTVTTAGSTKLINNGYNGWEVGDRAFWDGSTWQNWKCQAKKTINDVEKFCSDARTACNNNMHDVNKCQSEYYTCLQEKSRNNDACTNQTSPIKKRGVIQIQKDYILAAKEILKQLPSIMPKIGELDYCIPGPNPNYKTNSTNAQNAYQSWIGSIRVGMTDTTGERFGVNIDNPTTSTYLNTYNKWSKIYTDNPSVWNKVKNSQDTQRVLYEFLNICESNSGVSWWWNLGGALGIGVGTAISLFDRADCSGNYFYVRNGNLESEDVNILNEKRELMTKRQDYVNNTLFQSFYSAFDDMMNTLYFNNITKKYKEFENRLTDYSITSKDKNPAYIDMALAGLGLTKNIISYNDDINEQASNYKLAIEQANRNIAKLEPIKEEVGQIIKAAQERREKSLLEQIKKIKCNEQYQKCLVSQTINTNPNNTQALRIIPKVEAGVVVQDTQCERELEKCLATEITAKEKADFKEKYADCLDEENVQFFDVEDLLSPAESAMERCSNGSDDDLDGLVDKEDPDCK